MTASRDVYSTNAPTFPSSYTHGGGTPKGALIFVQTSSAETPSGVTYGGQACTLLVDQGPNAIGELTGIRITAWILKSGAPSGNQTVAVSGVSSAIISTYTINSSGNDLDNVAAAVIATNISGVNPSTLLELGGESCFVAEVWSSGNDATGNISPRTGWTQEYAGFDVGASVQGGSHSYDTVDSVDVTVGVNQASNDIILIAIGVFESSGGGGALTAGAATAGLANGWLATATATDATGGTAPYSYQWQRSARGAATWADITGQTSRVLVDRTVTASTNYDYRLKYTDSAAAEVFSNTLEIDIPAQVPVWVILGDSDTDEYRADDNRDPGDWEDFVLNWIEQLATPNGASGDSVHDRAWDVGTWGTRAEPRRTGFAQVWARSGATIDGMATQVAGAVGQIEDGTVTHAVLQCVANDWHNGANISLDIYNSEDGGTTGLSGTPVATYVSDYVTSATATIDALIAANVAGLVVVSPTNYFAWPQALATLPNATRRGYVAAAFSSIYTQLASYVTSLNSTAGVTVASAIESGDRTSTVFATADGQFVTAAGVQVDYTQDSDNDGPLFLMVTDADGDSPHAGTIIQAVYANTVLDAANELPGISYALYTDAEIRENAGLGGGGTEFQQAVSGSLTPTGDLNLAALFTLALSGSAPAAGALRRLVAKQFAGSTSAAGGINRHTGRRITGSMTATGARTNHTSKTTTGSATPSGASTLSIVFTQAVSGTVAATGAIRKLISKLMSGSSTATGQPTKRTSKSMAGSATAAGSVNKQTAVTKSGELTPEGETTSAFSANQAVSGLISLAGSLNPLRLLPPSFTSALKSARGWLYNMHNRR